MAKKELEMLSLDEKIEGTKMASDFEAIKAYLDSNGIPYCIEEIIAKIEEVKS